MNLVDAYVVQILEAPVLINTKWHLEVVGNIYGIGTGESTIIFNTKEEAENVIVGHRFLC